MHKTLCSVMMLGLFAGCKEQAKQAPPAPPPAKAIEATPPIKAAEPPAAKASLADLQKASMKTIADAMTARDAKKYASAFAPNAVEKQSSQPDQTGRDAIEAGIAKLLGTMTDVQFAFDHAWAKGPVVASTWVLDGTSAQGGKKVGVVGATVATFGDDGLITELHIYVNNATIPSQLDPKAKPGTFRAPPAVPASVTALASTGGPEEAKNLDATKAFYVALDAKKEADALALIAPDVVVDDLSDPEPHKGADGFKKTFEWYAKTFPDFTQLPMTAQWAVGNFVFSEGVLKGTMKGAIDGVAATNKPVSLHFLDVIEWKDGKIAHLSTYDDNAEVAAQIAPPKKQLDREPDRP